jgi:hypothetical protein
MTNKGTWLRNENTVRRTRTAWTSIAYPLKTGGYVGLVATSTLARSLVRRVVNVNIVTFTAVLFRFDYIRVLYITTTLSLYTVKVTG